MSINKFISWDTLPLKKSKGKEKVRCPECDSVRSDKSDKSLQVNHDDGFGKCHYCEALTFRDWQERENKKNYSLPDQEWRNFTKLSTEWVEYLAGRGVRQQTINELGWTMERHYQPAIKKECDCLVFNFFEGETLVNKKYRSSGKHFTQTQNGRPIFYNVNAAILSDEVWIVEGEMDVASLYEVGIKNVVSVPSGASTNDSHWDLMRGYFDGVKTFVIASDMDEKGLKLREAIAQRLGRHRCLYVEFEGKDANEDLVAGVLEQSIQKKQRFPVAGTFRTSDLMAGIMDLYDNGLPRTIKPKSERFGSLGEKFSTMTGQVTVVTGIPSSGKSNFLDWYMLNLLAENDQKCSWYTPEHTPMELYKSNLMEKVIGKSFWKGKAKQQPRITRDEIKGYEDWAEEKIYLTSAEGGQLPTWDWLFAKFEEQLFSYGINYFVIDAFNKVILPNGNKIDEISKVMTRATHFAKQANVQLFMVAHPTKMKKDESGQYEIPTLYDVAGSADFRNQTHNGLTVHRDYAGGFTKVINQKTKFSFQGTISEREVFNFCIENGRYYVDGTSPFGSLINPSNDEVPF